MLLTDCGVWGLKEDQVAAVPGATSGTWDEFMGRL